MSTIKDDSVLFEEWVTVNNDPAKIDLMTSDDSLVSKTEHDLTFIEDFEPFIDVLSDRLANLEKISSHREDHTVVWLDPLVDPLDLRTQEIANKLSDTCKIWNDIPECHTYLNGTLDSVFLIISGSCATQCLKSFHSIPSVDSIVIYCAEPDRYSWMTSVYDKVVACLQTETDLIEHVHRLMTVKCQMSFYIFKETNESATFLCHSILLHAMLVLLPVKFDNAKKEMIGLCRTLYSSNSSELVKIDEFQKTYNPDRVISWYTQDSFFYKQLNRALRTVSIETIYFFRSFIHDLHEQLMNIHASMEYHGVEKRRLTVYRGQAMSVPDLHRIRSNRNGLISMNGFLSTSRNYDVALGFTQLSAIKNYVKVLFQITVDPIDSLSKNFADISQFSRFPDEQEVLFDIGSIFRIDSVQQDSIKNIWVVTMKLMSTEEDPCVQTFRDQLPIMLLERNGLDYCSPASRLDKLFYNGRISELTNSYRLCLLELKDIYVKIGSSYLSKNVDNCKKALSIHEKAIQLRRALYSNYLSDDSHYANIGSTYSLQKVDNFHEKALSIYQKGNQLCHAFYSRFLLGHKDLYVNIDPIYSQKYIDSYKETFLHYQNTRKSVRHFFTFSKQPILCFDIGQNQFNTEKGFLSVAFSEFETNFVIDTSQLIQLALQCQVNRQPLHFISSKPTPAELKSFESKWLRVYCLNANLRRPIRGKSDCHQTSETYISTVEQLASKLYHDLGQSYSNAAEQVLNEEQDPETAKHLLAKSVRCYELLARSTKDIIKRYRTLRV